MHSFFLKVALGYFTESGYECLYTEPFTAEALFLGVSRHTVEFI